MRRVKDKTHSRRRLGGKLIKKGQGISKAALLAEVDFTNSTTDPISTLLSLKMDPYSLKNPTEAQDSLSLLQKREELAVQLRRLKVEKRLNDEEDFMVDELGMIIQNSSKVELRKKELDRKKKVQFNGKESHLDNKLVAGKEKTSVKKNDKDKSGKSSARSKDKDKKSSTLKDKKSTSKSKDKDKKSTSLKDKKAASKLKDKKPLSKSKDKKPLSKSKDKKVIKPKEKKPASKSKDRKTVSKSKDKKVALKSKDSPPKKSNKLKK